MEESCMVCGMAGSLVATEQGFTCNVCGSVVTLNEATVASSTHKEASSDQSCLPKTSFTKVNKDRVVLAYVSILQNCLLAHVDVLVSMGVDPILESVCRKIWLRVLRVCRILSPGSMHEALKKFSPLLNGVCPTIPTDIVEIELESVDRLYNHFASYTSCLWRFLKLEAVVWVLYAALVWLQEAISPIDLTLWIQNGTLPYLNMNSFQESVESSFGVSLPKYVFQPKSLPRPLEIEVGAGQLAEGIGLELPPINVPLHIFRLCKSLDFSSSTAKQAVGLYGLYWRDSGWDYETPRQLYYPQLVVGSCVLGGLKLNFGLDDVDRIALDEAVEPDWMEWATTVWKTKIDPARKLSFDVEDLLNMSSEDLQKAVHYIDSSVMAGCEYRKSYARLDKEISKLVNPWKKHKSKKLKSLSNAESRQKRLGYKFTIGDNVEYTPTLYLYPCRMYWFAQILGPNLLGADMYSPFDFVAVLSVISSILNVKPMHLESALATLEKEMLLNEMDLLSALTGCKLPSSLRFTERSEKAMVEYALQSMGYGHDEAMLLSKKDAQQIKKIRKLNDSEGMEVEPEQSTDDELVNKAVQLYHEMYCLADKQLSEEIELPVVSGIHPFDKDDTLCSSTDNPEYLLHRAKLSKALGEPLVSLGPRFTSNKMSFYFSQLHNRDDIHEDINYMSDGSVASEHCD